MDMLECAQIVSGNTLGKDMRVGSILSIFYIAYIFFLP